MNIPHEEPVSKQKREKMNWKDLIEPSSIPIALTGFVLAFSYSGILSFIPIYAKELGLERLLVTSLLYTHLLL